MITINFIIILEMNLYIFVMLFVLCKKISSIDFCDDSCGPIKENSITIYNKDSPFCKTDMPISFIKNKKTIVAFLRNFKEI